ncbi:type II toxin-antitoxin system prevent-host-death family antitoxin [Dysgonomonas termitidis]|uniref:Type II toxin-antitoxin system prevent-host-death family antitoxin n=1 Tax=Dysgonomonas termitidis TaxID=1516126 RepID=A0ABV9KRL7_9BACT
MLVISSREFRDKQAEYMDRVDNGEQIIIQRGKNRAYAITPVKDKDVYISDAELREFISGDELIERLKPRIKSLFNK